MKVTWTLLSNASGSIGGATASKARGGVTYLRSRVTPGNPGSTLQTFMRNATASMASRWKTALTVVQRAAWEALALAGSGEQSGANLYVKSNTQILRGAGTIVDDAPASISTPLTSPTVVVDVSSNQIQLTALAEDPWNADQGGVNIYATRPQSASRLARQFAYAYIDTADGNPAPITTFNAAWPASNPALVAGQVVYVALVAFEPTGGVSIRQEYRITVQA